jgi:AcrR family transcriptional regulator
MRPHGRSRARVSKRAFLPREALLSWLGRIPSEGLCRCGARSGRMMARAASATRARILAAARDHFERFPIEKTTMIDIAEAAGLSRPTVYRYFPNRDDLVTAVLIEAIRDFNSDVAAEAVPLDSLGHKVIRIFVRAVEWTRADSPITLALVPRWRWVMTTADDVPSLADVIAELWASVLSDAVERGLAGRELDVPAAASWLAEVELTLVERVRSGVLPLEELRDLIENFVLPSLTRSP